MDSAPWARIEDDARLEAIEADPGVRFSRWTLWLMGSLHALWGVIGGPFAGVSILAAESLEPATADPLAAVVAIALIGLGLGLGFVHFLAAWGLAAGRRWAWLLSTALGVFALLLCCVPVGGVLLWGALNGTTRPLFADRGTTV